MAFASHKCTFSEILLLLVIPPVKKISNYVLDIGNSAFHSVMNGCDHQERILRYSIFCSNLNEQSCLPRNTLGVYKLSVT